jgi:hypothetical protein
MHNYFSDLTITTEKLMELFVSLDPEMVDKLGGKQYLSLSEFEIDRIEKDYQSSTQRKEAYLDLYVHQHPCPTWIEIAGVLRWFNLHQPADLVENTYVKSKHNNDVCFALVVKKVAIHKNVNCSLYVPCS